MGRGGGRKMRGRSTEGATLDSRLSTLDDFRLVWAAGGAEVGEGEGEGGFPAVGLFDGLGFDVADVEDVEVFAGEVVLGGGVGAVGGGGESFAEELLEEAGRMSVSGAVSWRIQRIWISTGMSQ